MRSKYHATKVVDRDGTFDSKKENRRWHDLLLLQKAGKIRDLQRQVRFDLHAMGGVKVGAYVADFTYVVDDELHSNRIVVEDTKGFRTPLYRWKKKHFDAEYANAGWSITET